MRYSDTFNFESHGEFFLEPREVYTFAVRVSLKGKAFVIRSDLAPVTQTSKERELEWQGTGKYLGEHGLRGPDGAPE
jgi:hypothetical protein